MMWCRSAWNIPTVSALSLSGLFKVSQHNPSSSWRKTKSLILTSQIDLVGETAKHLWLEDPNVQFYIHHSLSILVFLVNGYIWWYFRKKQVNLFYVNWIIALIGLEVLTGISMYYIDFPFGTQPAHLVLASILFGFQFGLVLSALSSRTPVKTY